MWKRLTHPNIVPFVGITMDPLQLVLEGMPKGALAEHLEETPQANRIGLVSSFSSLLVLSITISLSLLKLLDIAEGLNYLHESHVVHGNLSGVGRWFGSLRVLVMTFGP